jgi:hypothetical protein
MLRCVTGSAAATCFERGEFLKTVAVARAARARKRSTGTAATTPTVGAAIPALPDISDVRVRMSIGLFSTDSRPPSPHDEELLRPGT